MKIYRAITFNYIKVSISSFKLHVYVIQFFFRNTSEQDFCIAKHFQKFLVRLKYIDFRRVKFLCGYTLIHFLGRKKMIHYSYNITRILMKVHIN
jgi:hypothetical protein